MRWHRKKKGKRLKPGNSRNTSIWGKVKGREKTQGQVQWGENAEHLGEEAVLDAKRD